MKRANMQACERAKTCKHVDTFSATQHDAVCMCVQTRNTGAPQALTYSEEEKHRIDHFFKGTGGPTYAIPSYPAVGLQHDRSVPELLT